MATTSPFARLIPDLTKIFLRFPASVAASLVLCIVNNAEIADGHTFGSQELWRINYALIAIFLAGGAGHMFAESRGWPQIKSAAIGLVIGAAAGALTYFQAITETHHLFVLGGLVLALMISAHLRSGASQNAVWLFNARLGLAAVLSVVIGVIFAGGLSAIVASLNYLFNADLDDTAYEHIWTTGVTLVGPIYGLTLVPGNLDEEFVPADENNLLERGVAAIINYVLVPLAVIYAVILHIYAAKIVVTWELPKGQIGTMVMLFGFGIAATYLVARPWAERGTRLLKWFLAYWFWLTIAPAVLLAIAVWTRISDYGVTPERYGLVIVFVWLVAVAGYLAFRRSAADSRVVIAVLSLLLLLASFGPWSARSISLSSQLARLTAILETHGLVEDGKLLVGDPQDTDIDVSIAASARSIVDYLRKEGELERLEPLFAERENSPFDAEHNPWKLVQEINKTLNIHHVARHLEGRTRVDYAASGPHLTHAGADMLLSGPHTPYSKRPRVDATTPDNAIVTFMDEQKLVIEQAGRSWQVSTIDLLKAAQKHQSKTDGPAANLQLEIPGDDGAALLLFYRLHGYLGETDTAHVSTTFWVLLPAT